MTEQLQRLDAAANLPAAQVAQASHAVRDAGAQASRVVGPTRPVARRRRGWEARYRASAALGDVIVGAMVVLVLYVLKFGPDLGTRAWLLFVAPVIWLLALNTTQTYRPRNIGTGFDEYRAIGKAALLVACAAALAGFTFDVRMPRSIVLPLVPLMMVASLLSHWYFRRDLYLRRLKGQCLVDTLVVGRADSVAAMIKEIGSESGMRVVAACVSGLDSQWEGAESIEGVRIYGPPETAIQAVDELHAEVVAVSSHPDLVGKNLRRLGWALAERDVDLIVSPGIVEVAGPRLSLRPAAGLSLLHVERPVSSGGRLVVKRAFDTLVALGLTIVLLPLFAVIALIVKLTSPGPVFYRAGRVGAHSEPFRMIKFRTMVDRADTQVSLMTTGHDTNAVLFKDPSDPRITSVGKVLRRYSLDELPQLLNVLTGEMSLVGPRPPLASEVELYESDAVQRLRVRPGMTGLWQISGRSDLDWEQSLRLDLWYVDNWSPILDLQILVRTTKAVFGAAGAY